SWLIRLHTTGHIASAMVEFCTAIKKYLQASSKGLATGSQSLNLPMQGNDLLDLKRMPCLNTVQLLLK
ncbi:hypothetical protein, partial [Polynucleobacter sp. 86C-FISCH]|uniref:hypothetical protein n=1 Tax=Polynucleobacter sp. 86C-FISCH TaxID=2689101 RepID=UPI001C0DB3EC